MTVHRKILFLFTETSLHAGTGAHLGAVDLPIQRERHTGYPIVQGSGLKGALRAAARATWKGDGRKDGGKRNDGDNHRLLYAAFGPPTERASDYAGALSCTDARVLALPVRSPGAHYVWVTCPDLLSRVQRAWGKSFGRLAPEPDQALCSTSGPIHADRILLEEHEHPAKVEPIVKQWADWLSEQAMPSLQEYGPFRERLKSNLVVLADAAFQDLAAVATEVVTRVALDPDTKTVKGTALWSEEALPADTLLYAEAMAVGPRSTEREGVSWTTGADVLAAVEKTVGATMQLGGDETTGRGWVSLRWCDTNRAAPAPKEAR